MDPRDPMARNQKTVFTPLMRAMQSAVSGGPPPNFCPHGCEDHELDDNGYCGHLVGFYNGGTTYEPRAVRKRDKRIIVDGSNRQPMQKGFRLVWITTTARVYSPQCRGDLVVKATDAREKAQMDLADKERRLLDAAESIRNPSRIDGEWGESEYDLSPLELTPA